MYAELLKLEELHPATLLGFIGDRLAAIHSRSNYLGPTLLPGRRVDTIEYEYILGGRNIPVAARIVDFNSPSPGGRRVGRLEKVTGELLTIKQKLDVDAKTLLRIQQALNSTAPNAVKQAIQAIYDDVENVLASLAARVEWLRWQALSTGKVLYNADGVVIELDYRLPTDNEMWVSTSWADSVTATPLEDLMTACDAIEQATGVRPARAVCHSSTWKELITAKQTREWVFGPFVDTTKVRPVLESEALALLDQLRLPRFAIYDVKVQVEDPVTGTVSAQYLLPEDTIVLLPPTNVELGETLFGPTPFEVFNVQGVADVVREITEAPGYVVLVVKEGDDPGRLVTRGEVTAVPAIPGIQYVGILHTRPKP